MALHFYVTNLMTKTDDDDDDVICPASKAMKKRLERRKHCALAVVRQMAEPKNFRPPQTPDLQKFLSQT